MSRVKCPKCQNVERILKAGIIRNKQRYFCKECVYHFIIKKVQKDNHILSDKPASQVSLQDIASVAGVSITTVSRALKNRPDISIQTREYIKELAKSLNYQPNILAQSLVNKSTHTLGVIIPSLETTVFSTMLGGIQEVASKAGYRVIICNSNENHETEIANIQGLMNHLIDGLLICHSIQTSSYEHIRIHLGKRIPIVQFYRVAIGLPISQILAEDEVGTEKVTDYLIKKGCRRIALLLGPKNLSITQKRFNGYKISLEKHGINLDIKLLAHVDFLQESVEKALEDWLKINPKIDGIISISDKSAAQIIQLLKKKSIKIPEEINVFGFGNEFTGQIVEPELSTFDTKTRIIGEEAARLIIEQIISGNQEVTSKLIPGEIILRGSA